MNPKLIFQATVILVLSTFLASCASSQTQLSEAAAEGSSTMVDAVSVEFRSDHYYAQVAGFYPDACSRVSSIDQAINGTTISIELLTDRPEDLMCAQMLTQYGIDILIATGGLSPGEYTVDVNGVSTTFTLRE